VCTFRDTLNKPESRSQRRALMAEGLGEFCKQMLSRNAPLKMSQDTPVIGRYYPQACQQRELGNGDLYVEFSGWGYGWTNLSKKVSFTMAGAVEYTQDFLIAKDECDIYGYFRPRRVAGSDFRIYRIEAQIASFLNQRNPIGDNLGKQLVSGKLAEGFTVIADHNKQTEVAVGIVELGQRPRRPFAGGSKDRLVYENLRTEVHQNQRDFIGPITVTESGHAIHVSAQLDGAPAMDLVVLEKSVADPALRLYYEYPASGPIAGNPSFVDVIPGGAPYMRAIPLPKGTYYVVLDNTPTLGPTAPQGSAFDDRAGLVSYLVEVGPTP